MKNIYRFLGSLTLFVFSSVTMAQYCAPQFGTGCGVGDQIQNFSTNGGLTNITNNNSGCSPGSYGNFTAMTHTVQPAGTVNFTVQAGAAYSQGHRIWVDWNQDGDFYDVGEDVWNSGGSSTMAYSGSFNVPAYAISGATRMRVRCSYVAVPTDPCAYESYGEVEDYTLFVAASAANDAGMASIDSPTNPTCAGSQPVTVTVQNFGTNQINPVTINWSINGTPQTPVVYNNTLDTAGGLGSNTASVTLGTVNITGATTVKAWTSMPNNVADTSNANDTNDVSTTPAMSGTYTIGAGGDYTTFQSAINDLAALGVCAAVIFNVDQATFNETMNFPVSIAGTSPVNTITFQSDPSNTANPVVTSTGYVINMQYGSLHHIYFKELDLITTGTTRAVYVYGANNAAYTYTDIQFHDCLIKSPVSTSSGSVPAYIDGYYGGAMDFTFENCEFEGGYYGVYYYPYYGSAGSALKVQNSTISDFYYYGIYAYGYNANSANYQKLTLVDNTIINTPGTPSGYSIYGYYFSGGSAITGNYMELNNTSYSYGALLYYGYGSLSDPIQITNNIVTCVNPQTLYSQYGLRVGYGYYNKVYHNTMHITNNYSSSYGAYVYYTSSYQANEFKNNIVSTPSSTPYTMYAYGTTNYVDFEDNVYYAGGNPLRMYAVLNGTFNSLPAWQAATGEDLNSIDEDPDFMSNTNLTPMAAAVDNSASPLGILTDIFGNTRSIVNPDPGAIEFVVPTNNAGISDLIMPDAPLCVNDTAVVANLKNTGQVPLTSCSLTYELNGIIQSSILFTGNLPVGADTAITIVANTTFSNGDSVRVWSSMPNGVQDSAAMLDTASVTLFSGLSGTYTIPGSYATVQAAADDIMLRGVCDHVIMSIAPGTYTEQVVLGEYNGASENATVTFTSSTGNMTDVVIAHSTVGNNDNYVVYLNGADWVRFNDLTIRNNSTGTYGTAVRIENGAENNIFDHCHIRAGSNAYTGNSLSAVFSQGQNHNLTLTNNKIDKGGYGLYINGGSTTSRIQNVVVKDNEMKEAYYWANYLYYIDGLEFHNNHVYNDSNLYLYNSYGVYCYYVDKFNITGNKVGSSYTSGTYGGYGYPFYMAYCMGYANPRSNVANNCFNAGAPGVTNYGYYGMYFNNTGYVNIHNNTANRLGGYSGTGYYALYIYQGGLISLMNNALSDYVSGLAMYVYGNFAITESDNNSFFAAGTSLIYAQNIMHNDLESYQEATGFDQHSINIDPVFVDTFSCVTCNPDMNDGGAAIASNLYDIDSNMRSQSTPDIGAVEFVSPLSFTLGPDSVYCADELTMMAGPAQIILWDVNGTMSSEPTITLEANGQTTTFDVQVYLESEYCGMAGAEVEITLVPNANLDSTINLCIEEDAVLNPGGTLMGSYMWSTGATTPTIQVSEPGMYTVTKDEYGCESTASTIVTQSEAVEIEGSEVCDDLPVTLDATILNGTTYAWSGGTSQNTATNTFENEGWYGVTVTDAFGCESIDSFEVVVLGTPNAVISVPSYSGLIYTFDASNSTNLSSTNTTVLWNFGAGAIPQTSTNMVETVIFPWVDPSNPEVRSVQLTVDNGCDLDNATLEVTPNPTGMEELENGAFALYPNPANTVVTIMSNLVTDCDVFIIDMKGSIVQSSKIAAGLLETELDVSNLAAGTYAVKMVSDYSTNIKPIIIQ